MQLFPQFSFLGMAHIQTFDALAQHLLPQLLDRSAAGLVSQGFLDGGRVTRENWKPLLNKVFYAPLMRVSMQDFLSAPAQANEDLINRYTAQMEFIKGYIEHFGHESLPASFNPETDLTHLLMRQRTSQAEVVECMGILGRNPHFLMTLVHMQNFYCDYINRLEASLKPLVSKADKKTLHSDEQTDEFRMAMIFYRLKNVVFGNQALLIDVMGLQFLLIHRDLAVREGRTVGEMTFKDFMAFDRFTRSGKLYVQKGKQCPWSDAYHMGMQGKDVGEDGKPINMSGIHLWRLHQHIAPVATAMGNELREDILRAGLMISQTIGERSKQVKCPYRVSNG